MHREQLDNPHKSVISLIRRVNITLFIGGVVLLLLSFFVLGIPLLFFFVLMGSSLFIIAIQSRLRNLRLRPYVLSGFMSLVVVWIIALIGFYGPNTQVGNEFEAGRGTYVADKSVATSLKSVFLQADTFTAAALYGFHCHGMDCSNRSWYAGILTDYSILGLGVVTGNVLFFRSQK